MISHIEHCAECGYRDTGLWQDSDGMVCEQCYVDRHGAEETYGPTRPYLPIR